jgi:hypothetical protein
MPRFQDCVLGRLAHNAVNHDLMVTSISRLGSRKWTTLLNRLTLLTQTGPLHFRQHEDIRACPAVWNAILGFEMDYCEFLGERFVSTIPGEWHAYQGRSVFWLGWPCQTIQKEKSGDSPAGSKSDCHTTPISTNHHDPRIAIIHDVRGSEADYTLEENGFQYLKDSKPADIDFSTTSRSRRTALHTLMEEFLKNFSRMRKCHHATWRFQKQPSTTPHEWLHRPTDPSLQHWCVKVTIFNHIVRNGPHKGPAARPHTELTPKSALKMLKRTVPLVSSEAEYESFTIRR